MIRIIRKSEIVKVRERGSREVRERVSRIIDDVFEHGDSALRRYTLEFDGCEIDTFEIPQCDAENAASEVDQKLLDSLTRAKDNIYRYHNRQLGGGYELRSDLGVILGRRVLPVDRAGIYIPGGTASYPSSVLMNAVPAVIAGVSEIVLVTPPDRFGRIPAVILAAGLIAGVHRFFRIGGAQAIAALAYGTQSIPRVDKIAGPGNAYVAEAKRQVFGDVGIDMIAGPSDIAIIANNTARVQFVAADMLSQCEHDVHSRAVLITDSPGFAESVRSELERRLETLQRRDIARRAVEDNSYIVLAESIDEAFDIANMIAPEHLELQLPDSHCYLEKVKNAGSVFLGHYTPEALGDYFSGTNHTLPTGGTARFSSALGVEDFTKRSSYSFYSKRALKNVSDHVMAIAEAEGLTAHAESVAIRFEE